MKRLILTSCLCLLFATAPALGHWNATDPYKMHWPQLPDAYGWDIDMTDFVLADDWQCTETGVVEDIHFWFSYEGDIETPISAVNVSIHADVPAGVDATYSHPGNPLWYQSVIVTSDMIAGPWNGDQGWDDPTLNSDCIPDDHLRYWQLNLTNMIDPFTQVEGNIYWLDLQVVTLTGKVGWKTTEDPFNDVAVYQNPASPVGWSPIAICSANETTDLAFVITPEPATIALLGLGGLALLRRRKG